MLGMMHPGVRAAGAMQPGRAGEQFGQRRLDNFLDAGAGLLHLPAFIPRAVVSNDQFVFHSLLRTLAGVIRQG